jgi:replicative DNA helicase
VVMSQLNRDLERRSDKRPMLSDLRESGALEERSKCVVGLYRGSCYGGPVEGVDFDPSWREMKQRPSDEQFAHTAQLCVLKNSNGEPGTRFARWDGPTTTIS